VQAIGHARPAGRVASSLGAVSDPTDQATERPRLEPGTKVEVRTGFDRSWADGFEVAEVTEQGYRVRRRNDGTILPAVFVRADVRRERKSSMWWY
jgi:hypothetical protein